MNKKKLLELLQRKEARKAELKNKIASTEDVKELRSLQTEWNDINDEIAELRSMAEALPDEDQEGRAAGKSKQGQSEDEFRSEILNGKNEERGAAPKGGLNPVGSYSVGNDLGETRAKEARELSEKRGSALKESRSVTVGSSSVVLPHHQANDIRPTFNEVSTLVDRVTIKPLMGGESFKQPYVKGYGTGDYTGETQDYSTAEPVFGYADISKTKITAYAEDTEELQKLPAADYDGEVMKGIKIAVRKKMSREILIGDGTTGHFVGIFDDNATAIDPATDISISQIDGSTLDEIVFSYGGDEDVEDAAVLILNKKDLKAFAKLRSTDGKKLHNIVTNGNTGTIDSIPFIINSACKPISAGTTTAGQYCMAYGPLSNYMMTIFSDIDVQRSTDYKFKQGMIAHKGVVFAGGNVVSKNGFLRVKKGATT